MLPARCAFTAVNQTAHPGEAAPPTGPSALPCVYYDGACPLCSREIATYRRARGGDHLQWVDAQAAAAQDLGPALAREDALRRLHVRLPDGRLVSGAAAFVTIWQRLPAFRALAVLARVPGMLALMEALYRVFLRVRPLWRPRSGPP
ncbi:MAG: thiol-disulfide oxidoreductase DCC family protein [Rubrivivax sp.]|jgi:predicted DCC family thiol-disulfide oxidoreductase YuxK